MIVGIAWALTGLTLAASSWVVVVPINLYFFALGAATAVVGIWQIVVSRRVE